MGKKINKWTYHKSHSFTDVETGDKIKTYTRLYEVCGVYMAIHVNEASMPYQRTGTPAQIVKHKTLLRKRAKEGTITDLVFGEEITVIKDAEGFYKEVV